LHEVVTAGHDKEGGHHDAAWRRWLDGIQNSPLTVSCVGGVVGPPFGHHSGSLCLCIKREGKRSGPATLYHILAFKHSPPSLRSLSDIAPLCLPSLFPAPMASFPACSIWESHLLGLVKKGYIPVKEVLGCRLEGEGEVPHPGDDEVVELASFYERSLACPCIPLCGGSFATTSWRSRTPTQHCPSHCVLHHAMQGVHGDRPLL
jgi:hypothetical protein